MSASRRRRVLTHADLPFADSVRALAGWNQTVADWERFLELEPDGCFLAECNGSPAGTATTLVYDAALAWIGMVLVHPDFRRRGIGRALLERCLEHLCERGVRCIKLDATPAGKKVYDQLGFKAEWSLTRWERAGVHSQPTAPDSRVRSWRAADEQAFEPLDLAAFGVARRRLVPALARQSLGAFVFESGPDKIAGYGLLRSGA
jgi:GNAT superfamily N-acetyltransferase